MDQIADAASFVSFFHAGPEAIELGAQYIRFIEQDHGVWQKIKDAPVGTGHRSEKFPAGKHGDSAGPYGSLYDFFRSRSPRTNDALSRKPRVNRAQQMIADRSLRQRQQQRLIH